MQRLWPCLPLRETTPRGWRSCQRRSNCLTFVMIAITLLFTACANPLIRADTHELPAVEHTFHATPNQVYYAIRWAFAVRKFPVAFEDLRGGVVTSAWIPTRVDSHFIQPFASTTPDYGTTMMQQQMEIRVIPAGSDTTVSVMSRVKSLVTKPQSSGREEKALIDEMANYLRGNTVEVTNVGVEK